MKLIIDILKGNRASIVLALTASIISGLSSTAVIGMVSRQFNQTSLLTITFITGFVGLIVLAISTNLLAKWLLMRLATHHIYSLRTELALRMLATPFAQIETIGSPRLLAVLTQDAETIGGLLIRVPPLCVNVAIVAGCMFYLAWLSPMALFALFALAVLIYFVYRRLHKKARHLLHYFFGLRDQRFDQYESLTSGVKELQMNSKLRDNFITHHIEPTAKASRHNSVNVHMAFEIANAWSQSAYFIFILLLLLLIASNVVETQILGAYALIALYMRNAITQVLSIIPQWTRANAALRKIDALNLSERPQSQFSHHSHSVEKLVTSPLCIKVDGVRYSYTREFDEREFSIGPLNLELKSGELVFVTGANGSGKTTMFKVLTSLYLPKHGQILLNNIPITAQNCDWYRQHFSVVFADFHLFEDMVAADDLAIDENATNYLAKLQLDTKVTVQDGRLSTLKLSSGQRKRLALLAAYLADRPIYIFDEWGANQDPTFKEIFYRHFLPELKQQGKLVVVISHDDRYFDVADRIIKLENGQIAEDTLIESPALT